MTLENLEKILSQDNIKCEKTISETVNPVQYTIIASIASKTGKKKYGIISVVFENKEYNVDKTNIKVLIPFEYRNIDQINIETSITNLTNKETDLKPCTFIGTKPSQTVDLFELNINQDNNIPNVNYIFKKCDYYKGYSSNGRLFSFVLAKTIDNKTHVLSQFQGVNQSKIYDGVIISQNPHLLVIKNSANYQVLRKKDLKLLGTYTNEEIIDMKLCNYEEYAELFFDIQDFATITTKKNTKKLLPIITPLVGEHKNEALFLEPTEEFESIKYGNNWIANGDRFESGFTFYGNKGDKKYTINVRQDNSIEIIEIINKKTQKMN